MWLFLSMVDGGNICGSEEPSYQRYHNKILVHHSRVHKAESINSFLGKGLVGFGYLVKDLIMVVDSYLLIPWVQKQPNHFLMMRIPCVLWNWSEKTGSFYHLFFLGLRNGDFGLWQCRDKEDAEEYPSFYTFIDCLICSFMEDMGCRIPRHHLSRIIDAIQLHS